MPVDTAIRFAGYWIVVRFKDETVRMIQIEGELTGAIPRQLVTASRQLARNSQRLGRS